MEMSKGKYGAFGDVSLPIEERLNILMSELTIEEKMKCVATRGASIERLNLPGVGVGGEAAHGVEARNDQNKLGKADETTSFPQPIGMSATWNRELIQKAGEVTGTEARVISHRHPYRGLSRWAPTIDLERDPRWGRTEEGYGEDPLLAGEMSSAYIKGMQGDHPHYLRIAATLKHFYANNTEEGRIFKSSSIDPRNRYELYLEPFRRAIEDGRAEAVMTAYNKINGTPGMINPEVKNILKKQYGLKGHVVCDGGAMEQVANIHFYYGTHAETVANAIKAGVDGMSDDPVLVEAAVREAYRLGLLTEEEINEALKNTFRTKLRLGLYDNEPINPYDKVTEADINSPQHQEICRQVSREAVVLLKNEHNLLPLNPAEEIQELALIGPMGDAWYQDWYGGMPPYRKTLRQGIDELQGSEIAFENGLDRVVFRYGDKGLVIAQDGTLQLGEQPDWFIKEDWGEGSFTFRSVRTGKYLTTRKDGATEDVGHIVADSDAPFNWFVKEIFHVEKNQDDIYLTNRFYVPVQLGEDGSLIAAQEGEPIALKMEVVECGVEKACQLAQGKKAIILAVGCNSMINAKEEIDRKTIALPPRQERLIEAVYKVNPNIVLVLFSNYPYSINMEQEKLPAILWSATGSQDMGTAMAETIFGLNAPAGRLNMTWYQSDDQLPDIDDYDIIKGKRTYRYFDGEVLYPFGYGLTYTTFEYHGLEVKLEDKTKLRVSFQVKNVGSRCSDEVVQVYGTAPKSRVKKPIKQLLGFERVKDIEPGEIRKVEMVIQTEEFRFYDVISEHLMVEEGCYEICVGSSGKNCPLSAKVEIPGEKTGVRDMKQFIRADHYDDYDNIYLDEGNFGYTACVPLNAEQPGILYYGDCNMEQELQFAYLHALCEKDSKIELLLDGEPVGSWSGDTRAYTQEIRRHPDPITREAERVQSEYKKPKYVDLKIPVKARQSSKERGGLTIRVYGGVKLCYFRFE